MIAYLVLTVLPIVLLIVRSIRMARFYLLWKTSTDNAEKKAARTNFFIHLFICLVLLLIVSGSGYLLLDAIRSN